MKRLIQIAITLALAVAMTGCGTPYMIDRGRDAADIFTATVGVGAGADARIGPLHVGLLANHDVAGLRGGALGVYGLDPARSFAFEFDPFVLPLGSPDHMRFGCDMLTANGPGGHGRRHKKTVYEVASSLPCLATSGSNLHYNTQVEVVVGFGPTIRLGFNPAELLDFILGWFTIDIFADDEGIRTQSNQVLEGTVPERADPQH